MIEIKTQRKTVMEIELDRARCTGIGVCESIAPGHFEVGPDGVLTILTDRVGPEDAAAVENAVSSCPAGALALVPSVSAEGLDGPDVVLTAPLLTDGATGPAPVPTPETEPYWSAAAEGRLAMQFCRNCERFYFYPRPFCRYCWGSDVEWRTLSGQATLVSYVVNHRPLPPYEGVTPVIAVVELREGPRLLTNIVDVDPDPEALDLGMPLRVAFSSRGSVTVPVFRLEMQAFDGEVR